MIRNQNADWFINSGRSQDAAVKLVCFPHAGGAASAYHAWGKTLDADVLAVQLPGREGRLRAPLLDDFSTAVAELANAFEAENLIGIDDVPVAFFGHSMGALLAYELVHELSRRDQPLPSLLMVSGRAPPSHRPNEPLLHPLPDEAFLDELDRRFGGVPAALRQEPELMAFFLPILRADLTMLERHASPIETPVPVPIRAFGGRADTRAPSDWLQDWALHTTEFLGVDQFDGGHFYLHDAQSGVLARVSAALADLERHPKVAWAH